MRPGLPAILVVFSFLFLPHSIQAAWQTDGVLLCGVSGEQEWPQIVSDGVGGAIVVWQDSRNGDSDIYAQRVDATGVSQWTAGGVSICSVRNDQQRPRLVADGAGGAMITWFDFRNSVVSADIFAQRVNANGVVQWAGDGVALCTDPDEQNNPALTFDGTGGAIVAWNDYRSSSTSHIYAQRISGSGVVQWTANGVAIQLATAQDPAVADDGAGGAIIAWWDSRGGASDIYAQRIDALGAPQWAAGGNAICLAAGDQATPTLVADGAGGAVIAWDDDRTSATWDVYAQRVTHAGGVQWLADGVALTTAPNTQWYRTMTSDGAGGAVVAWEDFRSGSEYDIYAQKVDASGVVQWTSDGVVICTATDQQYLPVIDTDGAGGGIISWFDSRGGLDLDIYAQKIDASGVVQWTADGVPVCTVRNDQAVPAIVADMAGGAIVVWQDLRNNADNDIYAQRVGPNGGIPTAAVGAPPVVQLRLSPNFPNPFSGTTVVDLDLAAAAEVRVDVYDVAGRIVRQFDTSSVRAGVHRLSFDGHDNSGRLLPSGVYFYRVSAHGEVVTRKMVISR